MFTRPPYFLVLSLFAGILLALWIGLTGPDLGWASLHPPSYATHILAQAHYFMAEACDEHGGTLSENRSWQLLVHHQEGRSWFERLTRTAHGPSRVYAVLGLRLLAPKQYRQLVALWSTDTTTIHIFRSMREPMVRMSVGALVADTGLHAHWAQVLDLASSSLDPCAA